MRSPREGGVNSDTRGFALHASLLQTITATSPDAWLAFDRFLNIVLWNRSLEVLSLTTASDCLGQPLFSLTSKASDFLQQVVEEAKVTAVLAGHSSLTINRQVEGLSPNPKFFELQYTPWLAQDGAVLGGVVRLQQQHGIYKLTKKAGAASEQRFRIMADCSPVMLWLSGPDARCIFFNQSWLDFSGNTMEEELDFGWARGLYHEDFQPCVDTYLRAFNARQPFSIEYRLRRHDGEYRWILDSAKPFWNNRGQFAGYIGSCIDITELKKTHSLLLLNTKLSTKIKEQKKAASALRAANQELEDFIHIVSHDLRAPLRGILAFGKLLYEENFEYFDESGKKHLNYIQSCSVEMQNLINDLLKLAKANSQHLEKQRIDVKKMLDSLITDFISHTGCKHTKVVIAEDLPPCKADPALLKQLFSNLIDNAFKYSQYRTEPRLDIGWQKIGNGLCYYIKDNGVGFDTTKADKLFGLFQRLPTQAKFEGTGLGLAIAARIVKRHGGKIWATAQVDQGATFFFTLQRLAAGPAKTQAVAQADKQAHSDPPYPLLHSATQAELAVLASQGGAYDVTTR